MRMECGGDGVVGLLFSLLGVGGVVGADPRPIHCRVLSPHGHSGVITYNEYADAFYGMVHGCSCTQPSLLLLFALGRNM